MRLYLDAILVFLSGALADVLWCFWIKAVDRHMTAVAVVVSMALGCLSLLGLSAMLKKNRLMVLWVIGLGLGTWLAMSLDLM